MRRYLFAVLSTMALAATIPAVAVAHDHGRDRHDRGRDRGEVVHRHHRGHRRLEHFRNHAAPGMADADAGTVQSFKAGVLTIALTDGTSVSGIVNRGTEVQCEGMDNRFSSDDGGPGPSGQGGGDRGDRHDQGEDRGDRGDDNDANDDNGHDANDNDNPGLACTMALRTPGTNVRYATVWLTGAVAFWDGVDRYS
jgi:hypothetical protein